MDPIQITVCIPLYNGIEYLHEAIASIQAQTYPYWQAIIGINGHGPSGGDVYTAAQILVSSDPRFRVINYPYVRNVAEANNAMVADTTTEWIAHLDADDIWLPQKLEKQIKALQGPAAAASILGTQCVYFGESNKVPPIKSGWITMDDLMSTNHIINSSTLLKTSVAKYNNRFYGCEDYDLWLRSILNDIQIYNLSETLVKHRIHASSQFNTSKKQDVKGLRSFYLSTRHKDFTLVTAFYNIPSKFSAHKYMEWITPFFIRYSGHMIIYTEEKYAGIFRHWRRGAPTEVRVIPPEQWEANTKFPPGFWESQKEKDPESVHTPELYKIWYEKHVFVKRAIQENPFRHTRFMWCDAGVCRNPDILCWVQKMPGWGSRILKDKMTVLEINPFTKEDHDEFYENGITDFTMRRNRLGGGILAGGIQAWLQWSEQIDTVMKGMLEKGMFVGKDQSVFNNIALKYPNSVNIIPTDRNTGNDNYWFYLLYYFGCDFSDFLSII